MFWGFLSFLDTCSPIFAILHLRKAADKAMDESYRVQFPDPWSRESAFTRRLLHDASPNGKCRFHTIDPWHMLHLGIGKSWCASGFLLLQNLVAGSTIDARISVLAAAYKHYCKSHRIPPIIRKIDVSTFGGGGSNESNGTWNKAAITSNFMRFLEHYCKENFANFGESEQLRVFASLLHLEIGNVIVYCMFILRDFSW